MKLNEFFNPPVNSSDENDPRDKGFVKTQHEEDKLADEVYWYILDHDRLHKECFIPIAQEISEKIKTKGFDRTEYTKKFMPMINKACMEYYKKHAMTKHPKDVFTAEMRRGLCQRLADQSFEDIEKGEYNLG